VDVDGRELAKYYLSQRDLNSMMGEIKAVETNDDLERFMLKHGENIVDCLGEQVDRIEMELKQQHPSVRHVDLEVL
jgi:zinc transporter 9